MFSVAQLLLQRMALNIKEIQVTWEKPPALVKRETHRFRHAVGWKTCRFFRSFCRYFIRPEFKVAEEIAKMIDPASELSKRESIFLRQTLNEVFITSHIISDRLTCCWNSKCHSQLKQDKEGFQLQSKDRLVPMTRRQDGDWPRQDTDWKQVSPSHWLTAPNLTVPHDKRNLTPPNVVLRSD